MPPCPAPDSCWLYLIRHAATENNRAVPPRLQGRRTDPGLAAEGWDQAAKTGRFLASKRVDVVYASPLLRSRQTAAAVAEHHGLVVQIDEGLIEVDVGLWEGRTWEEIERTDTEAYQAFRDDAGVHPYLGGESLQTVLHRVAPALDKILVRNLGRAVVCVAHNAVNRAYLAHLLGMPLSRYRDVPQDNGGVNLIAYQDSHARVVTVNAVFHL